MMDLDGLTTEQLQGLHAGLNEHDTPLERLANAAVVLLDMVIAEELKVRQQP